MMSDITLQEFNLLAGSEQQEVLDGFGVCIAERRADKNKIILYQLSSFYVEVTYNTRRNSIVRLYPFESTELLTPYLEEIDISGVF